MAVEFLSRLFNGDQTRKPNDCIQLVQHKIANRTDCLLIGASKERTSKTPNISTSERDEMQV